MPMSHTKLVPVQSFSPLKVPGLGLWLDASDNATLTMNSSTVAEIRDKSGNARHFTQGTALNQPGLTTINGRQAFAMSTSFLTGNAAANNLLRNVSGATSIWVASSSVAGFRVCWLFSIGTGTSARLYSGQTAGFSPGADLLAGGRRLDADSVDPTQWTSASGGAASVRTVLADWTNTDLTIRSAGAQVAQDLTWLTTGSTSDTASQVARIGADGVGSNAWAGFFGEILVWPRVLTPSELSYIERGIGRKWGLTVA